MTSSSRTAIGRAFSRRLEAGSAALVPYICAGWPDARTSLDMLRAAAEAGSDVIELGLPFSDPLADGPVIQKATFDALEAGMTVKGALDLLREFRKDHDTPVVIFTYLNPVVHHGIDRFVADAVEAGAQGLLLTDLPAGADPAMEGAAERGGLDLIRLLAPTTAPRRVPEVARGGTGFLYYISRTGVTGARTDLREALAGEVAALREHVDIPIAVGFGITDPGQARAVARAADGVVVGSALLQAMESGGVEEGRAFLESLREAIDEGARVVD